MDRAPHRKAPADQGKEGPPGRGDPGRGGAAAGGGARLIGRAAAFAPGHITGFFEIRQEGEDPAAIGSRGAGFSVRLGATSRVSIEREGFPGIDLRADGRPFEGETTRSAVELLLGGEPLSVMIEQTMDLPVSQGFGMSAAGALSAALATAKVLGRERKEAVWAAHSAEILNRSGLGDVVGAAQGGYEMRLEPGVEPYGRIESFRGGEAVDEVVLAVVDEAILTKRVLQDPKQREAITRAGVAALRAFQDSPGLPAFVRLSQAFSLETRLASTRIADLYRELGPRTLVSQCMLGGSVFAFGPSADLRRRLARWGTVYATKVDFEGARIVA